MAKKLQMKVGDTFNSLTFIKDVASEPGKKSQGLFRCECGREFTTSMSRVKLGGAKTCGIGHKRNRHHLKEGDKFNDLVFIRRIETNKNNAARGIFKCICGKETEKSITYVKSGISKHCGCKTDFSNTLPKGEAAFNIAYRKYEKAAKKAGRDFKFTKQEFREITSERCHYCGDKPNNVAGRLSTSKYHGYNGTYTYNGIDRMNNDIGYIKENCVPCCKTCNFMKKDMSKEQFLAHIRKIMGHS